MFSLSSSAELFLAIIVIGDRKLLSHLEDTTLQVTIELDIAIKVGPDKPLWYVLHLEI